MVYKTSYFVHARNLIAKKNIVYASKKELNVVTIVFVSNVRICPRMMKIKVDLKSKEDGKDMLPMSLQKRASKRSIQI
jgi:hypothetical protein